MPMIRLKNESLRLICRSALPGFEFALVGTERDDGDWDVPVTDETAIAIAKARLPGETDDDVAIRQMREVMGREPD